MSHLTDTDLHRWLDGADIGSDDEHLERCEECAARLEAIAEPEADGMLPDALAAYFEPEPDLAERTLRKVERQLEARAALDTFVGLLGIGVEAARVVLGDDDEEEEEPS